jgi:hypothetical protein
LRCCALWTQEPLRGRSKEVGTKNRARREAQSHAKKVNGGGNG